MKLTPCEEPLRLQLVGYGGPIVDGCVGATGKTLMDRLWREVSERSLKTRGINHWVYLPDSMLFTGVELTEPTSDLGTLERLDVSLDRYLRHVYRGPYDQLGHVWPKLMSQLRDQHETLKQPHLEIYGHWDPDPNQCETTIVIGLDRPAHQQ